MDNIYIVETIYEDRIGYDSYATIPQTSVVVGKENAIKIAERIVQFYKDYCAKYPNDDERTLEECCIYPTIQQDDGELIPDRKTKNQILIYNSQLQDQIDSSLEEAESIDPSKPVKQYEIWGANPDYPELVTTNENLAKTYESDGYRIREYTAYPVI